jgi:hypothetical protein
LHVVRALSALGFVISVIGLLLVCYNQFAIIPVLKDLNETKAYELSIQMTEQYEQQQFTINILSIITGVLSVIFCTFIYLKKRTRLTLIGIVIGFLVVVMSVIHMWQA